jgi:hypothetical protein
MTKHFTCVHCGQLNPPREPKVYPRNQAQAIRRTNKWRVLNPEKAHAINAVASAIRTYSLERGRCIGCGTDRHVCGYHDDYTKPLEVTWSCRRCRHMERATARAGIGA